MNSLSALAILTLPQAELSALIREIAVGADAELDQTSDEISSPSPEDRHAS